MIDKKYRKNRVSVIIPTYNYGHYIKDCIESVLEQSYDDIEIIVVDDGSTDNTKEVLGPYMDRIKYIYQQNAAQSSARNKGLMHCTGEYIQFLDSDDILNRDSIRHRVNYLKSSLEKKIAVCRNRMFKNVDEQGKLQFTRGWFLHKSNLDIHLFYLNIAPPHAFLLRREVIIETGLFDTSLNACEDYDYWLRAVFKGFIPHYCSKGFVYYRDHEMSVSHNLLRERYNNSLVSLKLYNMIMEDKHPGILVKIPANIAYLCGLLRSIFTLSNINKRLVDDTGTSLSHSPGSAGFDFLYMTNKIEELIPPTFKRLYKTIQENANENNAGYFETQYYLLKLYNFVEFINEDIDIDGSSIKTMYEELQLGFQESGLSRLNYQNFLLSVSSPTLTMMDRVLLSYEYLKRFELGRRFISKVLGYSELDKTGFLMLYH